MGLIAKSSYCRSFVVLLGMSLMFTGCEGCLKGCLSLTEKLLSDDTEQEKEAAEPQKSVAELFLSFLQHGHDVESLWRLRVDLPDRAPDGIPKAPSSWTFVVAVKEEGTTIMRYRVKHTTNDGIAVEKLWDFCLHHTPGAWEVADIWESNDSKSKECVQLYLSDSFAKTETPEALVNSILTLRNNAINDISGLSFGNRTKAVLLLEKTISAGFGKKLWRTTTGKQEMMVTLDPVAPMTWKRTGREEGKNWALLKYLVDENILYQPVIVSHLISKRKELASKVSFNPTGNYDFCLNETIKGWRIVGVWQTFPSNPKRCSESLSWVQYQEKDKK